MRTKSSAKGPVEAYRRAYRAGRIIYIYGSIDQEAVKAFQKSAVEFANVHEPMFVVLDTPGGDTKASFSLYQELRLLAGSNDVYLVARTHVFSAGMLVMMGVATERRFALVPTSFLVHLTNLEVTLKPSAPLVMHDREVRNYELMVGDIRNRDQQSNRIISAGSRCTVKEVAAMKRREEFLGIDDAIRLGFIAGVIDI